MNKPLKDVLACFDDAPPEVRWWYHRTCLDPKLFETVEFMQFVKDFQWYWSRHEAMQDKMQEATHGQS